MIVGWDSSTADPKTYAQCKEEIQSQRDVFAQRFRDSSNEAVLEGTRRYLVGVVTDEIFPRWLGTEWSFNGTTEEPRTGSIACGYFVSTVLRDVGFNLERVRLAQRAAEYIILTFCERDSVRRFRHVDVDDFVAEVKDMGPGLYVLGLDIHVGFVLHDGENLRFVHSSYKAPYKVVSEPLTTSAPVVTSEYRVIGDIVTDRVLRAWLTRELIPTRGE